jgi:hypothetical protein
VVIEGWEQPSHTVVVEEGVSVAAAKLVSAHALLFCPRDTGETRSKSE